MNEIEIPSPLPASILCRCCSENTNADDQFCEHCGYPLKGTDVEQNTFINARQYRQHYMQELNKKIKSAGTTLYVLAGLMLLMGLVYFFANTDNNSSSAVLITYAIVAIIFLLLGFWSRQQPVAAIISGTVLYLLIVIIDMIADPSTIIKGVIIKALIVIYLVKGMYSAFEAQHLRRQYNI